MNAQPTPERYSDTGSAGFGRNVEVGTLDTVQEQQLDLKLEVEHLSREVDQLRGGLMTLVSGLALAIAIAIATSVWFAYRLLAQEQVARQETAQAVAIQEELLDRVEALEAQVENLNQQLLENSAEIDSSQDERREQMDNLRDRLERIESQVERNTEATRSIEANAEKSQP